VVDAAVEDDAEAELVIDHGLLCLLAEVDDLQAAMAEGHSALREEPASVRPPRRKAFRHGLHRRDGGGAFVECYLTGNSTHDSRWGLFRIRDCCRSASTGARRTPGARLRGQQGPGIRPVPDFRKGSARRAGSVWEVSIASIVRTRALS